MAKLVSAWLRGRYVLFGQRDGDEFRVRRVPARYTFFVTGLDDSDRADLGRDPRVFSVKVEGVHTRVECREWWGRKEIVEILDSRAQATGSDVRILEADVHPIRRLLSDTPSLEISDSFRLGFFDLEMDSSKTFPQQVGGKARLLSYAIEDSHGEKWSEVLETDSDTAERKMWWRFFETCKRFDVLLAWNGDDYDFKILDKRPQTLGLVVDLGRWNLLDMMQNFKKYNMSSDDGGEAKTSFALDHVAQYLLGEGKMDFDSSKTREAWDAGGEQRIKLRVYNEDDASKLRRIEEKTGLVAMQIAVCEICRLFPDSRSIKATQQADGFLLALGSEHGYRWATRWRFDEDNAPEKFDGAYVMPPRRLGVVDNVHVCDFSGLYPSIMRTWNMSPDTKWRGGSDPPPSDEPWCQIPNRPTYFRSDKPGMIKIALDRIVAKRAEYQAAMKRETPGSPAHARAKRLQGAFKIVANCFYGVTGSHYSRYYDPEIAEGVTQTGKWLLENVIEEADQRGLDAFYGDTDSVFIAGDSDEMRKLVQYMNEDWSRRVAPWSVDRHFIDLDFEKTFKRIVLMSAKRYVGKFSMYKGKPAPDDMAPEVKGLEFKRGDTIRLAREMQREVVDVLLQGEDIPAPRIVRGIVDKWRSRLLHEPLAIEDVTITQSLSKPIDDYTRGYTTNFCTAPECGHDFKRVDATSPKKCPKCKTPRPVERAPVHVKVARLIRERGEQIGEGARVAYVVVGQGAGGLRGIPASDPDALARVDRGYYWEKRVFPATGRVLEKVWPSEHWGESKTARKQRVLEMAGQLTIGAVTGTPTGPEGPKRGKVRRRKKKPSQGPQEPAKPQPGTTVRRRRKKKPPQEGPITGDRSSGTAPRGHAEQRIRRRRKARDGVPDDVVVLLQEHSKAPEGGAEEHRRKMHLEAVRAAIEAHPGRHHVVIRIVFHNVISGARTLKAEIPTGLRIAKTAPARRAMERIIRDPDSLIGF